MPPLKNEKMSMFNQKRGNEYIARAHLKLAGKESAVSETAKSKMPLTNKFELLQFWPIVSCLLLLKQQNKYLKILSFIF